MTFGSVKDLPRRFYKAVSIAEMEEGFAVQLDGRIPRTPEKRPLILPSRGRAHAIAEEWERQEVRLDVQTMHLTRLANVALDRTPGTREALADEVRKYASTDLLCYLADHPSELRERQQQAWSPWLDWSDRDLGIRLIATTGVMAIPQPEASLNAAYQQALSLDDFDLTGLVYGTTLLGSAVLAFAVKKGELTGPEAFDLSRIDEEWQIERWGRDEDAERQSAAKRVESVAFGRWFSNA